MTPRLSGVCWFSLSRGFPVPSLTFCGCVGSDPGVLHSEFNGAQRGSAGPLSPRGARSQPRARKAPGGGKTPRRQMEKTAARQWGGVSGCGNEGPEKEVTDGKSESQEIRDREVSGAPLCV